MSLYSNIVLINTTEIINVVRRTLSKIDARLIDHGDRVGYIAKMIYDSSDNKSDLDFSKLYILCILHDIGAYKTDEINDMVKFEINHPYDHAMYGYLFLKNTSHLSEYADSLLYHHTSHSALLQKKTNCADYAEIIHLADRADILISSPGHSLFELQNMTSRFNPVYIDALLKSETKYKFSKKLHSGEFINETNNIISELDIKNEEIIDYLKLLVYAIDFRSPYTVTHTADTAIISVETAKLLSLSEHDLQSIYLGSFLHDIGKIAIPHEILDKPGKLTPEEYNIVKRHIPEGEEILRGVVSNEICNIALRHHEKLDGSGYSNGLKGDVLTLPERIVAVSDIVSALSQRRSYKEPFSKEVVISILNDMKLSGYICPTVVDVICSNYDFILNNVETSHDPLKVLYNNLLDEYNRLTLI